jgi:hypothetical protein
VSESAPELSFPASKRAETSRSNVASPARRERLILNGGGAFVDGRAQANSEMSPTSHSARILMRVAPSSAGSRGHLTLSPI